MALSEETKNKIRATAAAKKAAKAALQPTDAPPAAEPVATPRMDFDALVRKSNNLTLRQIYAMKTQAGMTKAEAFAFAQKALGA